MTKKVLGLDIGGANLKAAAVDMRARTVPFALWKQPQRLPAALTELIASFPDANELAVTMTGELCDCYQTKREGVAAILAAVKVASGGQRVRVWSTEGCFLNVDAAASDHLRVAAANWHALATFAGRYVPDRPAVLIDIGSTTTDIIPILNGKPIAQGATDRERMLHGELVYTGVRRTPICALLGSRVAAEFFATTHDAYLLLGKISEDLTDCDTADGRSCTRAYAHARLSRMLGGDTETISLTDATALAQEVMKQQMQWVKQGIEKAVTRLQQLQPVATGSIGFVVSGSGEFLVRELLENDFHSLSVKHGHRISTCAPAYALAVLAAEMT